MSNKKMLDIRIKNIFVEKYINYLICINKFLKSFLGVRGLAPVEGVASNEVRARGRLSPTYVS